jgi:hypothetical protein
MSFPRATFVSDKNKQSRPQQKCCVCDVHLVLYWTLPLQQLRTVNVWMVLLDSIDPPTIQTLLNCGTLFSYLNFIIYVIIIWNGMYALKSERKIYKSTHDIHNTKLNSTTIKATERLDHMSSWNEFLSWNLPVAFPARANRKFKHTNWCLICAWIYISLCSFIHAICQSVVAVTFQIRVNYISVRLWAEVFRHVLQISKENVAMVP